MSREEGFTIIQVLVAIIVAAVVTAVATPLFVSHQRSVQFSSAVLDFKSMLQRARALSAIEATDFRIDFPDSRYLKPLICIESPEWTLRK